MEFAERVSAILREGHWEKYTGQRMSPLVNPKDYATYGVMDSSGKVRRKGKNKKRKGLRRRK